jgi:hypothetical protein
MEPTSSVQRLATSPLIADQDPHPEMNIVKDFLALHVPCLKVSHSTSALNTGKLSGKKEKKKLKKEENNINKKQRINLP